MTGVRDAVELYINLNITLVFAFLVWLGLRFVMRRTDLRHAYNTQLKSMKILLALVALSPILSILATRAQEAFAPGQSLVLSDLVVAAYLRGDLSSISSIGAIEFERLLNVRSGWTESFSSLSSPGFIVIAGALGFGLLVFMARFTMAVWQVHSVIHGGHRIKRIGRVDVHVTNAVRVPLAARGLLRHHIILPYEFGIGGRDRQMALAHELQHFRNRDLEWEIGLELLRPLFFWNPAFVLLKRHFDRLRELSCDEAVLERRGFEPLEYAMCLLRFCERAMTRERRHGLNVALVSHGRMSARRDLAQRLLSLKTMGNTRPVRPVYGLCFALVLGLGVALFTASIQTHKDWSHDRLMLSTVVNLERLQEIQRGF